MSKILHGQPSLPDELELLDFEELLLLPLLALLPLLSDPLLPLGPLLSDPLLPLGSLLPLGPLLSLGSLEPLGSLLPLGPLLPLGWLLSLDPLPLLSDPLLPLGPLLSLGSLGPLGSLLPLNEEPLEPLISEEDDDDDDMLPFGFLSYSICRHKLRTAAGFTIQFSKAHKELSEHPCDVQTGKEKLPVKCLSSRFKNIFGNIFLVASPVLVRNITAVSKSPHTAIGRAARPQSEESTVPQPGSNLFFFTPYSINGKLGEAYNQCMKLLPSDNDWACFLDRDVMFLTPDFGHQIREVTALHPGTGLFTCLTNRIGCASQLYQGTLSADSDILNHRQIAETLRLNHRREVSQIPAPVSGFLLVVQKKVWRDVPFDEKKNLLHVDWDFSRRIASKGLPIYLMQGLYVFHYYRLAGGPADLDHLT